MQKQMASNIGPHKTPLPYRRGVGILLLNSNNQVFLGKRMPDLIMGMDQYWQMPQGGVLEGESDRQAAFRELAEETSITQINIIEQSQDLYYYDFPTYVNNFQYRGQEQRWFVAKFFGIDQDINLAFSSSQGGQQEFVEWMWRDIEQVVSCVVPFKRNMYRAIIKEFMPMIGI